MALLNGVDLVLELPVLYATSSAENFADGAIRLLNSLGVVDDISFGSEASDINVLNDFADVLYQEPREYKSLLSTELDKGLSYPKARENALIAYLGNDKTYSNVLSSPNNILGIEYLKALKKCKSEINPITINRNSALHNKIEYSGNIVSGSAIREIISKGLISDTSALLPSESYSVLEQNLKQRHIINNGLYAFEKEVIYSLRKSSIEEISSLQDVSEGLENSIKKAVGSCNSLTKIIKTLTSKRYTQTRIQRIMLYCLLNITKKDIQMSKKTTPYARILGFNENGRFLISEIVRTNPKIEFIASVKKYTRECSNKNLQAMLEKDILATDIYTLGYNSNSKSNLDYTKRLITI